MGVQANVASWDGAITQLRQAFAPKKPAYLVYEELAAHRQEEGMSLDVFISKKRLLLAELPAKRHDEATELDLVYARAVLFSV
jgi:hypothetical protein